MFCKVLKAFGKDFEAFGKVLRKVMRNLADI